MTPAYSLKWMSNTPASTDWARPMRGINKRGWIYEGWCSDDPFHTEDKRSLYGAHNFLLMDGGKTLRRVFRLSRTHHL